MGFLSSSFFISEGTTFSSYCLRRAGEAVRERRARVLHFEERSGSAFFLAALFFGSLRGGFLGSLRGGNPSELSRRHP